MIKVCKFEIVLVNKNAATGISSAAKTKNNYVFRKRSCC
jgi:hypothetical protein